MTESEAQNKKQKLCHMVGNYSQEILYCSYNDDDVLSELLSGEMIESLKRADKSDLDHLAGFGHNVETFYKDMMDLVTELRCWPDGWYVWTPLKELDQKYLNIIKNNKREDLLDY